MAEIPRPEVRHAVANRLHDPNEGGEVFTVSLKFAAEELADLSPGVLKQRVADAALVLEHELLLARQRRLEQGDDLPSHSGGH